VDTRIAAGIAAAAAAVGVVGGAMLPVGGLPAGGQVDAGRRHGRPPGTPADLLAGSSDVDRAEAAASGAVVRDLAVATVDASAGAIAIPRTRGGRPLDADGDGAQDAHVYTAQYVANALESCRMYRVGHGVPAPRLAWWEAIRDAMGAGGVVLPPPTPPRIVPATVAPLAAGDGGPP